MSSDTASPMSPDENKYNDQTINGINIGTNGNNNNDNYILNDQSNSNNINHNTFVTNKGSVISPTYCQVDKSNIIPQQNNSTATSVRSIRTRTPSEFFINAINTDENLRRILDSTYNYSPLGPIGQKATKTNTNTTTTNNNNTNNNNNNNDNNNNNKRVFKQNEISSNLILSLFCFMYIHVLYDYIKRI